MLDEGDKKAYGSLYPGNGKRSPNRYTGEKTGKKDGLEWVSRIFLVFKGKEGYHAVNREPEIMRFSGNGQQIDKGKFLLIRR
jgi:hypothetical protein